MIAESLKKQKERNDQLCDPSLQMTDKERFAMLDALQSDQGKIDELTERWGSVQEELEKAERDLNG